MSTPELHLETLFVLDSNGRIVSTREPGASRGPLFHLTRSMDRCAWAIRADVPARIAIELDAIAREEPPAADLRSEPVHAQRYLTLLGDRLSCTVSHDAGPAFTFPQQLAASPEITLVEDEHLLDQHFRGWIPGEIAAGRSPVTAITIDGHPVSVCFSARASHVAAEAGVETAEQFRGRGLGSRVTEAWALAVRTSGRTPLYSTSWTNGASLGVARRLGLIAYANSWSISGGRESCGSDTSG